MSIFHDLLDQEMDGLAIVQTFGSSSGPDCLKNVINKFGVRVKVYTAIKSYLEKAFRNEVLCVFLCIILQLLNHCHRITVQLQLL